eukprot:2734385-Amphidinium_carterae.1
MGWSRAIPIFCESHLSSAELQRCYAHDDVDDNERYNHAISEPWTFGATTVGFYYTRHVVRFVLSRGIGPKET